MDSVWLAYVYTSTYLIIFACGAGLGAVEGLERKKGSQEGENGQGRIPDERSMNIE